MRVQSSHLALIDTLMMAYTVEMVSVERVMSCINRYSPADPVHGDGLIQGLPYDTEDAITTWINKVRAGTPFCGKTKSERRVLLPQTGDILQLLLRLFISHAGLCCRRVSTRCERVCQLSLFICLSKKTGTGHVQSEITK